MLLILIGFLLIMLPVWMRLAGTELYKPLERLPEVLAALAISIPGIQFYLSLPQFWPYIAFIGHTLWLYWWIETGHGVAFGMGWTNKPEDKDRKQFLSPFVDWLTKALGIPFQGRRWCQVFMGTKGFLIGLGMLPFGLLLPVLWPLVYQYSADLKAAGKQILGFTGTPLAEVLSGFVLLGVSLLSLVFWMIVL